MSDMPPAKPTPRRKPYVPGGRTCFTQITDRDRAIFQALFDYRYLTFDQLASLVPHHEQSKSDAGHEKKLRERLTELYHSGHVDRIRTQHYPSVYALAGKSAEHIAAGDDDFQRLDWIKKTKGATWHFIEHTVEVAEFRITVAKKLSQHPSIDLITGRTLMASIKAAVGLKPTQHPLLLRQSITLDIFDGHVGKSVNKTDVVGTVPDHLFLLQLPAGKQRAFPVEIDRGSMPVRHRGFTGSSIERKLHVYAAAALAKKREDRWGFDSFRVLFVTDSPQRSKHIRDIARSIGTDVAWTAERETIAREPVLSEYWLDATGRAHALLPEKLVGQGSGGRIR